MKERVSGPLSALLSHGSTSTAESKRQLPCLTVSSALSGDRTRQIPHGIIKTHVTEAGTPTSSRLVGCSCLSHRRFLSRDGVIQTPADIFQ